MRVLRMIPGLVLTAFALMALAPGAQASEETATSSLSMTPISGNLLKGRAVPVNWEVGVEIKAPYPQSSTVTPLKEIHAHLPKEMSFNPDPKMKVCPDSAIGPDRNLSVDPDTAIALCPDSVIGNGTAEHYISHVNSPSGPNLTDSVVVIFNGGRTATGLPRIKIYGYSSGAGIGIYMEGVLKRGQLDVSIPVLPFDSATGKFHLEIPGSSESHKNRRGQDPAYVRTTCATGRWQGQVDFLLGTRDTAGEPLGPESTVFAPPLEIPCSGGPAVAALGKLKVKGPGSVKANRKSTYRVRIKNSGNVTVKKLKVSARGRGARGTSSAGSLAPGRSKVVKVKVRFSRPGKSKVKFRVTGRGIKARPVSKKVKVFRPKR